jgi:hypothetical protein
MKLTYKNVGFSVWISVHNSVWDSIWSSVFTYVWETAHNSVMIPVRNHAVSFVGNSTRYSVWFC